MTECISELQDVLNHGFTDRNILFSINVESFICNAHARAFIKCTKGHIAYYGCERCEQSGKRIDNRIVLPFVDAPKCTDQTFSSRKQNQHHKPNAISPRNRLKIGLVTQVPLEYMHLICLGAMHRLLMHWLRGKREVKISVQIADTIIFLRFGEHG